VNREGAYFGPHALIPVSIGDPSNAFRLDIDFDIDFDSEP